MVQRKDTRRNGVLACALMVGAALFFSHAFAQAPSLAERLGFSSQDKVLLIHADDLAATTSVNRAAKALFDFGLVKSGSLIMPGPETKDWANYSQKNPQADLGIHLTLHSEWENFRWRPVAPLLQVPTLIDGDGYQRRSNFDLFLKGNTKEIERELRAQIEKALKLGLHPTHLDVHKGTLFLKRRWFQVYLKLAKEYQLPPMLPTWSKWAARLYWLRLPGDGIRTQLLKATQNGFLMLDHLNTDLGGIGLKQRKKNAIRFIKELEAGVTQLIIHPAFNDKDFHQKVVESNRKELRRPVDAAIFLDPEIKALLQQNQIHLIGWRDIKKAYRWNTVN